jgi:hypothetical protein
MATTLSDASAGRAQPPSSETAPAKTGEASNTEAKSDTPQSEPSKPESEAASAKGRDSAASDAAKTDEAEAPATTRNDVAAGAAESKPVESKSVESKSDDIKIEAPKSDTARIDPPKADEPKAAETPSDPGKATATAPATAPVDVKKDTARLPGAEKAVAAKPQPKRSGQIAVFVSRKDSKLYVRQEFKPLFEAPVTIAPSDRPLGTHVFTAQADKTDSNLLHWSVVSLPMSVRYAARNEDDDRPARRRKTAVPVEAKSVPVPDGPAEALDRITIAPEVMTRIAEALTTGGSIVISDQGVNQGETSEGTDFIIPLR